MLNKNLSYLWMLVLAAGCGQRIELIEGFNDRPRIVMEGFEEVTSFTDSVKVSLKSAPQSYSIRFSALDVNHNLASVRYRLLSGQGSLYQDNLPVEGPLLHFDRAAIALTYVPQGPGRHALEFVAEDDFGEQGNFVFELIAFENIRPRSVLGIITPSEAVDAGERVLDASGSYDGDRAFGGSIVAYEFLVLDKLITVDKSAIPVIFPSSGSYEVDLRVMDNDGEWSEPDRQRTVVE